MKTKFLILTLIICSFFGSAASAQSAYRSNDPYGSSYREGKYQTPFSKRVPRISGHTKPAHTLKSSRADAPLNDNPCLTEIDTLTVGETINWNGTFAESDGEVFHVFTIATCADIVLDFCGTSTLYNPDNIFFYSGQCDTAANYFFSNPFNMEDCADGNPVATFYAVQAGTYYVSLYDEEGSEGTYSIAISTSDCAAPPANDSACGAVPQALALNSQVSFSGTLSGATDDGMGVSQVWEAFILTDCASVIFDWCGTNNIYLPYNFLIVMADCNNPFSGTFYSSSLTSDSCSDGNYPRVAYNLMPGTYYIGIPDISGSYPDYLLTLSAVSCIPLPANDICTSVTPQTLNAGSMLTFSGTTAAATFQDDYGVDYFDEYFPSVWHAFTIDSCATVKVQYCNTAPAFGEVAYFLTAECPLNENQIFGSIDIEQCAPNATIMYFELAAGTYYLPVQEIIYGYSSGPYSIDVSAEACGPYCAAWSRSTYPLYEKISNVKIADIDNSSTLGIGYENFTSQSGTVLPGLSYPIDIALSYGYYGNQVFVWIDFNQDYIFGADEKVFTSDTSEGPYSGIVEIPATALLGATRMRVRMHDALNAPKDNPCGRASYGQVEDYTIIIDDATRINTLTAEAWSLFPNPGDGNFTLRNGGENASVLIEIIDVGGRVVLAYKSMIAKNATYSVLAAGSVVSGIYNVRISSENFEVTKKIIVL